MPSLIARLTFAVFLLLAAASLPAPACAQPAPSELGPSMVVVNGRQLMVRKRMPDSTLAAEAPYVIRGVNWSPAGTDTNTSSVDPNNGTVRRVEFGKWYATDIPLMKAMNVNTVRLFMDPGLPGDPNLTVPGLTILDELYRNGIMVIMTVDDAINDVARVPQVVNHYKNHPAVLMWSLGSEWNLNRFFNPTQFPTADSAAEAIETAAQLVKSHDSGHPVASSYGSIVNKPNGIEKYVNQTCPSVDIWSFNEYRGPGLSRLFDQWRFISGKPMFLGEFGIDAYSSTTQQEDPATHAQWGGQLWDDIARNLSADDPGLVALGGAIFSFNDEWWKTPAPSQQDSGGWNNVAFPDGVASEDWWGIVNIQRSPRQLYGTLTTRFAPGYRPPAAAKTVAYRAVSESPVNALFWENGALIYHGAGASIDGGRGFNIAAIDPLTGRLRDPVQRFDTWASRDTGTAFNAMIAYLDNVPDGTILLMSAGDELGLNPFPPNDCQFQSHSFVATTLQRLHALGSTMIQNYCYGDQWSMIAIRGHGVALSEVLSRNGNAVAEAAIYTASLEAGFNLIGNSLGLTLDVIGTFGTLTSPVPGVSDNVLSVWRWNAASGRWAFHTPLLSAADSAAHAASRNYDVLLIIEPGEGYWVNAVAPMSLPRQTGAGPFGWSIFNFSALAPGFNLIATGSSVTPSQFNAQVSETPPVPGEVPTGNFVSLWAWDALFGKWYFYSPILEASGGLPAVKAYADSHNYLHFQDYNKTLGLGTGFWVNRP